MIPKVISLKKSGPTRGGFSEVVKYIQRDDKESKAKGLDPIPAADMGLVNLYLDLEDKEERKWVAEIMNSTASQSVRIRKNPAYHVSLSWPEGEHPNRNQCDQAVNHVMKSLGLDECEAIWALHRDTDNDHLHLVVNTIHPELGKKAGPPRFDYAILHKACREIEIEQGWSHDNGAWVVTEQQPGETEIMRRREAHKLGIWNEQDNTKSPITQPAARAEKNQGADSFQTWVSGAPAADLKQALNRPGVSWADVHETLARHGVVIQPKGSGMIVSTTLDDGRVLTAKASQLGRWSTKAALEKKLGPFQSPGVTPKPEKTYQDLTLEDRKSPEKHHASSRGDDSQRAARRDERAKSREDLAKRFEIEQSQLKAERPKRRQELREKHKAERAALSTEHRASRHDIRTQAKERAAAPGIALSIWAFQAAKERETLQKQQAVERKELTDKIPRSEVWRTWLDKQAGLGDEAAKAALRGIRYREQRNSKKYQQQDGIEGEELDPLRKLTVAALQAEIDHKRQLVIYRGRDGQEKFTDTGPRIVMHDKASDSLEAALRIASQKYGGKVDITGSSEFRERAAREAVRLGITVTNADLQTIVADEQAKRQPIQYKEPQHERTNYADVSPKRARAGQRAAAVYQSNLAAHARGEAPESIASVRNLSSLGLVHDQQPQVFLHQDAPDRVGSQNTTNSAMRWEGAGPDRNAEANGRTGIGAPVVGANAMVGGLSPEFVDNSSAAKTKPAPDKERTATPKKQAAVLYEHLDRHLDAWGATTNDADRKKAVTGWMREIDRIKKTGASVNAAMAHTKERLGGGHALFMNQMSIQAALERDRQR